MSRMIANPLFSEELLLLVLLIRILDCIQNTEKIQA